MDDQFTKMTTTPVPKLVTKLAVPTVISMLITSIYNLADAYFVGGLGTSASGAIGVVMGLQTLIQSFGFMFGQGAGSLASRMLGSKDNDAASRIACEGFAMAFITGGLFAVVGFVFFNPMLKLLGSTDTILPYAKDYCQYILLAAPFFAASCVLNNVMRYEGHASLAMIGLTSGAVLNILLDPLLIYVFNMGVGGAGLATALSQAVSFCLLFYMYISGRTQIKISLRALKWYADDIKEICATGFPTLLRQGLTSVSTMALNNCAGVYGDAAVAAMSIVGRVCWLMASVMVGIGQGLQPVAAYNHGAKKYSRVKKAYIFTIGLGEIVMTVFAAAMFIVSSQIIGVFRDDPEVVAIGVTALRLQCAAMLFQPLTVASNMVFQSIGESRLASLIAMLRSGVCFLPAVFILPMFFGIFGVQCAQTVADVLSFIIALPFAVHYMRNIPNDV